MKTIMLLLVAVALLSPAFGAVTPEMKAFAEGAMRGEGMIPLCAANYNVGDGTEGGMTMAIVIKPGYESFMQSILYNGYDVCKRTLDRYPSLPSCLFGATDSTGNALAAVVIIHKV